MIRFCTYILLVALTLQSFYRSIMAVDYQINLPDYIAKCINKDKPQLHCDGQCVLMKKIREKEKEETKKNLVVYEYSANYVHKERTVFIVYQPNEEIIEKTFSPYLIDYRFTYNSPIFRPPNRLIHTSSIRPDFNLAYSRIIGYKAEIDMAC